jgi:hypothetical protein
MSLIQLNEIIPVKTPLGDGYAIILEGNAHEYYWTVALNENCAIVTFRQDQIRISRSYTHGRRIDDKEMKEIIK